MTLLSMVLNERGVPARSLTGSQSGIITDTRHANARVLEVPSPRWSALECDALSGDARPAACDHPELVRTTQERAWTSPIWYSPPTSWEIAPGTPQRDG